MIIKRGKLQEENGSKREENEKENGKRKKIKVFSLFASPKSKT